MPVWMPTLSTTVSSTAIYLQFNDSNPLGTTYTIFRDGIVSPDGDNNSTYNFMTDDTGLQPGSVYNYTVVAFIGQESTAESDVMQICTGYKLHFKKLILFFYIRLKENKGWDPD